MTEATNDAWFWEHSEATDHATRQIEILPAMRADHLRSCRFCQRRDDCDVIRGFDCAIAMFKRMIQKESEVPR
jgi:hypothetical protein